MSDQTKLLVCMPWGWEPPAGTPPVPSVKVSCHRCNRELMMDELNLPKVMTEKMLPTCLTCAGKLIAADPEPPDLFRALVGGRTITLSERLQQLAKQLLDKEALNGS